MKANIYDSFTNLQEVILGDVDLSWSKFSPIEHKGRIEHILGKTKEDLDNASKILLNLGIDVKRPIIYPTSNIVTPYFSINANRMPLSPSDLFLILGSTIIETASYDQQRYFEHLNYRHLMLDYFNLGNNFISMPTPILNDQSYCKDQGLTEVEILMEASNILQVGKDIFITTQNSGNKQGLEWLKRHFVEFNFHEVDNISGHIDCHWSVIRPGLVVCNNNKLLHSKFYNWDIITTTGIELRYELLDKNLQDDDWLNTNLGITFLVLNNNKILFNSAIKDCNLLLLKQLEAKQFDICFIDITYGGFFNQGLTCMILETRREGLLENYF